MYDGQVNVFIRFLSSVRPQHYFVLIKTERSRMTLENDVWPGMSNRSAREKFPVILRTTTAHLVHAVLALRTLLNPCVSSCIVLVQNTCGPHL